MAQTTIPRLDAERPSPASGTDATTRLSSPVEDMAERYDVVVVGSGYGGAIAAARLARAGRSVCVLERGRELHSGAYPDTLPGALRDVQLRHGTRRRGRGDGLFDLVVDSEVSVLVGCGLGGTSLINAGVALRPPAWVFDDERWPAELRGGAASTLDPHFRAAETMLGSTPVPTEPPLPKHDALARAAQAVGGTASRPPVNVAFETGPNAAGVMQQACTLCGDCVSGCNHGAKGTVLVNYLPDAVAHGAELFTGTTVRTVLPAEGGGWTVTFRSPHSGRRWFRSAPASFVHADVVVLAAGTLGSTEILFRSRAEGLAVSARLGERFSGNGDTLAWAYDADEPVRGIGLGRAPATDANAVGPCITGMIDLTGQPVPGQGLLVQEGAIPGALASVMPAAFALIAGRDRPEDEGRMGRGRRVGRALRLLAASAAGRRDGATDRTLTYLAMSDDAAGGRLRPEGDTVVVDWTGAGDLPVYDANDGVLRRATTGLGATYVRNPLSAKAIHEPLVTVHPLGGCAMADDGAHGVVDHRCRVFAGEGTDVHEGLLVADGAVVPRPLAVNPLLTISALAERACELLVTEQGWTVDEPATPSAPPERPEPDRPPALRFTERLRGHAGRSVDGDPLAGEVRGRDEGTPLEMVVTAHVDDLPAVLADPARPVRLAGTVTAPAVAPRRLRVLEGGLRLVEADPTHVETWTMGYSMLLGTDDGRHFRLDGTKVLHDRAGLDAWADTTTLYVRVRDAATDRPVAAGVVRLGAGDLLRQLASMRVTGVESRAERLRWRGRFEVSFLRSLRQVYGGPLVGEFPERPAPPTSPAGTGHRRLALPVPEPRWCDGRGHWHEGAAPGPDAWLRLTRFEGGRRGPVLVAPGFGMSASSFLTDTTETNLVEHLVAKGYDVWLLDYRASIDLPSARRPFTMDDIAREDWPCAVAEVLRVTRAEGVQALGHCAGSLTLMMALGAGMPGVRSAVCMQFTLHPVVSYVNMAKVTLGLGELLGRLGLHHVQPPVGTLRDKLVDLGLRAVPIPAGERCGHAVCRWINAIYGLTHTHDQLDEATHAQLANLFGVGGLTPLRHLGDMVRHGVAVDRHGEAAYTAYPERLRLPMLLVSGERNRTFRPEGSLRTLRWLQSHNEPQLYERLVLPGYAHLDALIGRSAATDVFPHLSAHLDRFNW